MILKPSSRSKHIIAPSSANSTLSEQAISIIARYIETYGEAEAKDIIPFIPSKQYQRCIVIPAFNESEQCVLRLLESPLSQESLLLIIVINQPDTTDNTSQNAELWNTLTKRFKALTDSHQHQWLTTDSNTDILLIDRFTHKIPRKQGVGLARKIGADIASQLIIQRCLLTPLVHSTDADTHLPDNYFSAFDQTTKINPSCSAATYPYRHQLMPANQPASEDSIRLQKATELYEKSLHHYVDGLCAAGSPYAYHTIGSCLAIHMRHYAQARGFPKRAGGEDFYLLNKLSKLAPIISVDNAILCIESRLSDRVPFGTGPAVSQIMNMQDPETEYRYYHPQCFIELKILLEQLPQLFSYKKHCCKNNNNNNSYDFTHYQPWLECFTPALQSALLDIKIDSLFKHIDQQINSNAQCLAHSHLWLDGFKTLKLVHALEKYYPKQVRHTQSPSE